MRLSKLSLTGASEEEVAMEAMGVGGTEKPAMMARRTETGSWAGAGAAALGAEGDDDEAGS